jgi:hypothetical protein
MPAVERRRKVHYISDSGALSPLTNSEVHTSRDRSAALARQLAVSSCSPYVCQCRLDNSDLGSSYIKENYRHEAAWLRVNFNLIYGLTSASVRHSTSLHRVLHQQLRSNKALLCYAHLDPSSTLALCNTGESRLVERWNHVRQNEKESPEKAAVTSNIPTWSSRRFRGEVV